ncbi:MAG: glycosyltransferase [Pseudomonadota bacterium]
MAGMDGPTQGAHGMKLAVSIINYRTGDMTIAAVQSVLDALGDRAAEVIVVDNASGDGSAEQIEGWIRDDRVKLVKSVTNSGFSGGHNQGMAAAPGADYYLILNSDAVLHAGFFDTIEASTAAHPKAGLIAPQLEWEDGQVQQSAFRFHSIASELIRGAGSGPVTKLLKHRVVALDLPPDPDQIEWASFACIVLKGEMVRAIGPMDEGYFLYFEDAEYALRAHRAGWGVVHTPEARAIHFRGGSGPVKAMARAKKRMPSYYWRSRTRFLRQACGPFGPLFGNLAWVAGRGVAHLRLLAGKSVPPSNDAEWRDIWTNLLKPLEHAPETRK